MPSDEHCAAVCTSCGGDTVWTIQLARITTRGIHCATVLQLFTNSQHRDVGSFSSCLLVERLESSQPRMYHTAYLGQTTMSAES